MLLLKLWNYLRGYVIILVEGYSVEKFINICARRHILLWDVKVQCERLVSMKLGIGSFKLLRPIARKAGCSVKLLKKTGLPFIFNRYRRRKAFFAGVLLFIVMIFVMSSFVWSIDINGNMKLETARLEDALAKYGIKTGALKYKIDTDKAVTGMLLDIADISWISINLKGTRVKVELRERIKAPEIIPNDVPCDIIAGKDGIIKKVIAMQGVEAVGEGDTVKKGQVLISGRIPLLEDEKKYRLVHAMGTVTARTWYEETEPIKLTYIERLRTGRIVNNHTIILFSWKLDILHRTPTFENWTMTETRNKLAIGENLVFPIEWQKRSYIEEKLAVAHVNEQDAKEAAASKAYRKIEERLPQGARIVKKDLKFVKYGGGIAAKATVECLEEIGVSGRIGGN